MIRKDRLGCEDGRRDRGIYFLEVEESVCTDRSGERDEDVDENANFRPLGSPP